MVCSYLTCTGHTYYPSPSTHCKRAYQHFTEKEVVASEVTGPTWFSSQCMTYGHQDTYWTMQSLSITGTHTSPSLAFTHTPRSTHVPPPPTPFTFRTVFCLCLISWWPSLDRAAPPCETTPYTSPTHSLTPTAASQEYLADGHTAFSSQPALPLTSIQEGPIAVASTDPACPPVSWP